MTKELKHTAIEMICGIVLFEVLLIAFFFFVPIPGYSKWSLIFGAKVGFVLCLLLLFDMAWITEEAGASGDPGYAKKKTMMHAMFRKAAIVAVVLLFWKSGFVNVMGIVVALFGLKCGAYLQPTVHNILKKGRRNKGNGD